MGFTESHVPYQFASSNTRDDQNVIYQQNEYEKELYDRARRGLPEKEKPPLPTRTFETGATRDSDDSKLDFEGFLSPLVIERFAQHMHAARKMPDGTMRESDNWQKGIPLAAYMKSMWRHFFAVWQSHRGNSGDIETELCALRFNVDGMLHEILKAKVQPVRQIHDHSQDGG
jgi:hypothetical protein